MVLEHASSPPVTDWWSAKRIKKSTRDVDINIESKGEYQYICKISMDKFREAFNISDDIRSITFPPTQYDNATIMVIVQADKPLKPIGGTFVPEVSLKEITRKKPGRPRSKS